MVMNGRLNTVKIAILSVLINKFKAIPVKISSALYWNQQAESKIHIEMQNTQKSQKRKSWKRPKLDDSHFLI